MDNLKLTTLPRFKSKSAMTWEQLGAFFDCHAQTLKRYATDWHGINHHIVNGRLLTSNNPVAQPSAKQHHVEQLKRLVNFMAAKGMSELDIADRLGLSEEEVEQAINDAFVDNRESEGFAIMKSDFYLASVFRAKKGKKKKAP